MSRMNAAIPYHLLGKFSFLLCSRGDWDPILSGPDDVDSLCESGLHTDCLWAKPVFYPVNVSTERGERMGERLFLCDASGRLIVEVEPGSAEDMDSDVSGGETVAEAMISLGDWSAVHYVVSLSLLGDTEFAGRLGSGVSRTLTISSPSDEETLPAMLDTALERSRILLRALGEV